MHMENKPVKKEVITEYGERLMQGEVRCLAWLYEELVSENSAGLSIIADYIKRFMSGLGSAQLIKLDEQFRDTSSMEWMIRWKEVDIDRFEIYIKDREAFLWVARLGTFHPNGFFREKCVRKLLRDRKSVPFLLLRLNDWVKLVRDIAGLVANNINDLTIEELIECLPYIHKVENCYRRDYSIIENIKKMMASRISDQMADFDLRKLRSYEMQARRMLYRIILENQALDKDGIKKIIGLEKNSQLQAYITTGYMQHYNISLEELDEFENHKSEVVQRFAIEQKYKILSNVWDGLEEKLLASSAGLRSSVKFILQYKTDIDVKKFYMDRIDSEVKRVCILGVGENGNETDAEFLMKYLDDDDSGVVKRTLRALGMLMGDKAADIFWKYLHDERKGVRGQAYREIIAAKIRYKAEDVYNYFMETDSVHLKRKLVMIISKGQYWDRLPYMLLLLSHEDETISEIARNGLRKKSMYGKTSKENAAWIREILSDDQYCVPENMKKSILFDLKVIEGV